MKKIQIEFLKDIDNLCAKYEISNINKADALGQVLNGLSKCCAGNSIQWVLGGLSYAYAIEHNVVDTLKKLVELLGNRQGSHLNYNDMNCNLRGWHKVIEDECLECCSILTKLKIDDKPHPKTKDCPRCKGTGIEPEFHNDAWVIHYDDHGNGFVFAVIENCIKTELHIRRLPYNLSREKQAKVMKKVLESVVQDRYDHPFPLLRYRDTRDEGFSLSLEYDTEHHNCEVSMLAINDLSIIAEHFPCVIDSLEKGEEI